VNKLLKMHQEMANAMKKIKKMGGLKGLAAMFGKGGGLGQLPGGMGDMLGGAGGKLPSGLPGLGGGMPQLPGNLPPGFDKFIKK
jgi:signal recognition particle subunit SRP54